MRSLLSVQGMAQSFGVLNRLGFAVLIVLLQSGVAAKAIAERAFFAPYLAFDPGSNSIAVGDVNEDGHPDLVTADGWFLPGVGDGTFQSAVALPFASPSDITIADLNQDGHPDLVAVYHGNGTISIALGMGGANFAPVHNEPTGGFPTKVVAGDLDGDTYPDLVVATPSGACVHLGNGDGTFAPFTTRGHPAESVLLADLNLDAALDIVGDGSVLWSLLGNGDGTFGAPQVVHSGCPGLATTTGDEDGDGWPDLATVMCSGYALEHEVLARAAVFYGNGDGTFVLGEYQSPGLSSDAPASVALADVDGDGFADVITTGLARGESGLFVSYGAPGRGTVGRQRFWGGEPGGIIAADLTGDTHPELVVAGGHIKVLIQHDGMFGYDKSFYLYSGPGVIAAGDINNDGPPDLVISSGSECCDVFLYSGHGDGTFTPYATVEIERWPFAIADINQDGLNDLVTDVVSIFKGRPDGTLGPQTMYASDADSVNVGDQNGDGYADLVIRRESIVYSILYGAAANTYGPEVVFTGMGARSAAVDLDGDSETDSLSLSDWEMLAWLRDSGGKLEASGRFGAAGEEATYLVVSDFNQDMRPDVAVVKSGYEKLGDGWVSVLLNALPEAPTSALVSLAHAAVEGDGVRVTWQTSGTSAFSYRLYRSSGGEWTFLRWLTADGTGRIEYGDRDVAPGQRYGYRLGFSDGDQETYHGEAWVDVPVLGFSLEGAVPNPVKAGAVVVRFRLPTAKPATLELFDLAGRRLVSRPVGTLGPGWHTVEIGNAAKVQSGLYVLRLTQGVESRSKKFVALP